MPSPQRPPKSKTIPGIIFDDLLLALIVILFAGTAAFFARMTTSTPESAVPQIFLLLLFAYLVSRWVTGFRRRSTTDGPDEATDSETELDPNAACELRLLRWMLASPHFPMAPDDITLLDRRTQFWPGLDQQRTSLYRVDYGEKSYVALAEPVPHCFPKEIRPDVPVDRIYDAYKEWFADNAATQIVTDAANEIGDPHFTALVKEALEKKPNRDADSSKR